MFKHYAKYVSFVVSYGKKYQREDNRKRQRFYTIEDAREAKDVLLAAGYASVKIYRMEDIESCKEVG